MPEDTVYIACSNHGNDAIYHSMEGCRHLKKAGSYREVSLDALAGHRAECKTCAGGGDQPTSTSWQGGHYRSLVAAAKRGEGDD